MRFRLVLKDHGEERGDLMSTWSLPKVHMMNVISTGNSLGWSVLVGFASLSEICQQYQHDSMSATNRHITGQLLFKLMGCPGLTMASVTEMCFCSIWWCLVLNCHLGLVAHPH